MRSSRPRLGASVLVGLSLGFVPFARAQDLNGAWKASPLRVSWSIGDWGEACGPRPSGGNEAGGTVTLATSGNDFTVGGLGRSYSTNQCWEQMPGLRAQSHSASPSTVRTTCKMPSGDPRQATVITTWAVRENAIYFDETGQYQLVTEKANCTASVRRTRLLERIARAEEPTAQPATTATASAASPPPRVVPSVPAAPPPPPAQATQCKNPGPAVSLEVSPKTKLMLAGETFAFRAEARDAHGCRASVEPRWNIASGQELGQITADGRLTVKPSAPSGALTLRVKVEEKTVEVAARIVGEKEYERLLAGGGFGVQGESLDRAVLTLTSSEVAVGAVAEDASGPSRGWVLALLAAAVGLAGAALFFVLRKQPRSARRRLLSEPPTRRSPTEAPLVAQAPEPFIEPERALEPTRPGPGKVCPVCARTYPPESTFCGQDGARLVRVN